MNTPEIYELNGRGAITQDDLGRWRSRESAGKAGEDDGCILDGVRKRVSRASGKSLREMVERSARPEAPHPA